VFIGLSSFEIDMPVADGAPRRNLFSATSAQGGMFLASSVEVVAHSIHHAGKILFGHDPREG
jgi:hypothetical protein